MKKDPKKIAKVMSVQLVVYTVSFVFFYLFSLKSFANENQLVASKTVFCMDVAMLGLRGYEAKQTNQKLVLFSNKGDNREVFKVFNNALRIGYNSNSGKEAADKSFKQCIESKIWNENLKIVQ
jgi:hypothetical protein